MLESYGLIGQVGRWVLEQSFTQCKRWSETHPGFIMDVNISYLQLLDADFVPFVEQLVERTGVDPASIVLEMTESYFVTDMDALRATFDRLRSIGIRIAMDDFGTGYSSLCPRRHREDRPPVHQGHPPGSVQPRVHRRGHRAVP